MNPLLPLLLLASAAGLLALRRREAGLVWCAAGLAAMALLAPALMIVDGIPSPAASLADHPPWQQVADPSAGNPQLQDVTYQVHPWLLHLRHELRSGRLPLWNPYQSSGTPYWSNGSSAPLFPLHLLFAALPTQVGWLLLPWLRVVIGALGVWFLARHLGLSRPAAILASLAFPLAGMPVGFLLFPMGNALALVPWVLCAVERLAAGRGGWPELAVAGGLQLLAGHPETAVHTAMLSGLYLLVRGVERDVAGHRAWLAWLGGWVVAGGLAAIQLLPLTATLLASSRWQAHGVAGDPPSLALLLVQPLRLVLPDLFGSPAAGTWWGSFYWPSTAVYAGAITLPLAAAGLAATRRAGGGADRRWLAVVAMLVFAFLAAYHLPPVRQLLAELPVVGRALHHRLLFAVDLTLALLAGAGVDRWRAGRGRGLIAGAVLVLGMLALAWWLFREEWLARGLLAGQTAWTLWVVVAALLLVAALAAPSRWRPGLAAFLPVVLVVDLVVAHAGFNRALPLTDLYPVTGAVAFLAERPGRIAAPGEVLRPNAAMVYRLRDIRGDDSVKSARYEALLDEVFAAGHPTYFRPLDEWDPEWLDRLVVRWIVTPPESTAPPVPASLAYDGPDARVWRRPSPLRVVRWAGTPTGCTAAVVAATPGRWEIEWSCAEEGRLVVAESWDPGWRARTGTGRRLAVEPVERVLLGVALGPGSGRVVLAHRPEGLLAGALLSAAALLVLFATLFAGRRTRRHDAAARPRGALGEAR